MAHLIEDQKKKWNCMWLKIKENREILFVKNAQMLPIGFIVQCLCANYKKIFV